MNIFLKTTLALLAGLSAKTPPAPDSCPVTVQTISPDSKSNIDREADTSVV
ncbi:MAG: hypothetical protein KAT74_06920 [Candidatus Cloacimonetes bacterium]|nr:hypothetical protein [Candidatus Cloacimonadota bacterium]